MQIKIGSGRSRNINYEGLFYISLDSINFLGAKYGNYKIYFKKIICFYNDLWIIKIKPMLLISHAYGIYSLFKEISLFLEFGHYS